MAGLPADPSIFGRPGVQDHRKHSQTLPTLQSVVGKLENRYVTCVRPITEPIPLTPTEWGGVREVLENRLRDGLAELWLTGMARQWVSGYDRRGWR